MSDRQHLPPEPCEPPTAAPPKPADARRSVTAATGLDFPFRETFEELIALAKQWEGEAKDAQDSMERVVLKGCARRLREVIDVLD